MAAAQLAERFVSSNLTRLDLSDDGNLKDAVWELGRADGDNIKLACWARRWGEALCRAVPDANERAEEADAERNETLAEDAKAERELEEARDVLDRLDAPAWADGDVELSVAERIDALSRLLTEERAA